MDANGDGVLSKEEIKSGFEKIGKLFSEEELDKMFNEIDNDKNGTVSFSEFLAAGINREKLLQKNTIINVFK